MSFYLVLAFIGLLIVVLSYFSVQAKPNAVLGVRLPATYADPEVWRKTNQKSVQITLDGPKEIHDRRRPHKDGDSSYDVIMRNLKDNAHFFEHISVRINVDKTNEKSVPDLLKQLQDVPKNVRPYLAPVHTDNVHNAGFAKGCYDSKDFGLEVESQPEFIGLLRYPQPMYGICGAVREEWNVCQRNGFWRNSCPPLLSKGETL